MKPITKWAAQWNSKNYLDGKTQHLLLWDWMESEKRMMLFSTRKRAREYIQEKWGYIATRPDLKAEPHGWRVPRAVRVTVTVKCV